MASGAPPIRQQSLYLPHCLSTRHSVASPTPTATLPTPAARSRSASASSSDPVTCSNKPRQPQGCRGSFLVAQCPLPRNLPNPLGCLHKHWPSAASCRQVSLCEGC